MAGTQGRRAGVGSARRWGEAEARRVVEDWRRSGLSLVGYTRRAGLGYERVARWKRRLARRSIAAAPLRRAHVARLGIRPVRVVDSAPASVFAPGFELVLASGHAVRVPAAFDEGALRRLLALLEA
jgi:hypothetical protein